MGEAIINIKRIIYDKALHLIQYAPQTEKTLFVKLRKRGYPGDEITSVINKLKSKKLINDVEYAKLYTEELIRVKSCGYYKLMKKLTEKGIAREDADRVAKETIEDFGGEMMIVKNYIFKNPHFFKEHYKKKDFAKIKNKLYTHGFVKIENEILNEILDEL